MAKTRTERNAVQRASQPNKRLIMLNRGKDPQDNPAVSTENKLGEYNYYSYFEHNDFPDILVNARELSPTNGGIIERKAQLVKGKRLKVVADNPEHQPMVDRITEGVDEGNGLHNMLFALASDYFTFGGYCIEPITSQGVLTSFAHQDWTMIRRGWMEAKNEDGETQRIEGYIIGPY